MSGLLGSKPGCGTFPNFRYQVICKLGGRVASLTLFAICGQDIRGDLELVIVAVFHDI
jgi:hypothetical protein